MADRSQAREPLELIYKPEASWYPALIAFGLAAVVGSVFTWWPYGVIGGAVALVAAIAWIREAREGFVRLRRRQRITTTVIPAETLKRPE
jgi:membrane-associated phospholipid phosphatase